MNKLLDISNILFTYGFVGELNSVTPKVIISADASEFLSIPVKCHQELGKQFYYAHKNKLRWFDSRQPKYYALLPHISFTGDNLEPVWTNDKGRCVVAWYKGDNQRILLIGINVTEEIIRHRQGDAKKVEEAEYKGGFGFNNERANYLFEEQILPEYSTQPWADYLGFLLAENLSILSGYPLIEPFPKGAKGAVILTGDDDWAYLEKYAEQLRCINNIPITYFLVTQTRHTPETLAQLPSNVEIGLHPDALAKPEEYDRLCAEQAAEIRQLSKKPIRTLRNHGYLSKGYLGHLKAWEENNIALDVNYTNTDGTALNGSFLPMRVRRLDGTWSDHYSLLTAFGDGIIYALKLSEKQAAQRIRKLANQIEVNYPGVLVFNFHPQNIQDTRKLHEEVIALSRRSGWIALGLETYLNWLEMLASIKMKKVDNQLILTSPQDVKDVVLRYPVGKKWRRKFINAWSGELKLDINIFK
ncbi:MULTISPECIES: hypothetical protein [unclassified Anabaena]|uniref:polysaccharide deacetylase WbmS family protein n=1 Tax=unclassified Anabaena TaxID=2619674 RepID=UPI000832B00E|nr:MULTISPECIES: hypothetical protein [unclassified Anabaena]